MANQIETLPDLSLKSEHWTRRAAYQDLQFWMDKGFSFQQAIQLAKLEEFKNIRNELSMISRS